MSKVKFDKIEDFRVLGEDVLTNIESLYLLIKDSMLDPEVVANESLNIDNILRVIIQNFQQVEALYKDYQALDSKINKQEDTIKSLMQSKRGFEQLSTKERFVI